MIDVRVIHFPGADGGRWVLSVNGFIIKLDADERVIRRAAEAYYLRWPDQVGQSA